VPISEADISVVIPTYRYRDRIDRCVRSALESGAGEIVVVDDCSSDGTIEHLAALADPRLVLHGNQRNLGLWENHLEALRLASKPWIKFMQADDFLLPGGLARMAAAADENVSVVWGNPRFINESTGQPWLYYRLIEPRRLNSHEMLNFLMRFGWVLGSPSMMLLRSDAVERDPDIWRTTRSADLIAGVIAVSRGDTVLLPEGIMAAVCHARQDAATQGISLSLQRTIESLQYLRGRPEADIKRLSAGFAGLAVILWARALLTGFVRRRGVGRNDIRNYFRFVRDIDSAGWLKIALEFPKIASALKCAWVKRHPISIDAS
jgi:glycosyltransferase involved in cell wall biosynthesis